MSAATKITAKFQITLPREVRRALKANVGDLLGPSDNRRTVRTGYKPYHRG